MFVARCHASAGGFAVLVANAGSSKAATIATCIKTALTRFRRARMGHSRSPTRTATGAFMANPTQVLIGIPANVEIQEIGWRIAGAARR
jgi:hypothetical protein